jgi:hypothetical protein
VIDYFAIGLLLALDWLQTWADHSWISVTDEGATSLVDMAHKKTLAEGVIAVEQQCKKLELEVSVQLCYRFHSKLQGSGRLHWNVVESELEGIRRQMISELAGKKFAFIPASVVQFFEQEMLFGEQVSQAFPLANAEIKSAGNCLSVDLNTAAIFHLMRVAELGIRALAKHLNVKLRNNQTIEYAQWGTLIHALNDKIAPLGTPPHNRKKTEKLQFYQGVLIEANALKDLWRNPVSHLRGTYNSDQARGVFERVKGFMQRLSIKVKEIK